MRCARDDLGVARRAEGVGTSAQSGHGARGMAVPQTARRRGLHHAARTAAHALSSLREARARGGAGDARTRSGRIRSVACVRVLGGGSAGRGGRGVRDGLSGGRCRCGGVRVCGRRRAPQDARGTPPRRAARRRSRGIALDGGVLSVGVLAASDVAAGGGRVTGAARSPVRPRCAPLADGPRRRRGARSASRGGDGAGAFVRGGGLGRAARGRGQLGPSARRGAPCACRRRKRSCPRAS